MSGPDIPPYLDFLSAELLARLDADSEAVPEVPGLRVAHGLRDSFADIETPEALRFICLVYERSRAALCRVLEQRIQDRAFIDAQTAACTVRNRGRAYLSPEYETVLGQKDAQGRIVVGPLEEEPPQQAVIIPEFLAGEQVTLFGPPDTPKMAINAMNALHRKLPAEPAIVTRLVEESGQPPLWGADDEDSKTPIMADFLAGCRNLIQCFDGSISFEDPRNGKRYALAEKGLARPIKRIPGLALPDGSHLYHGNPLPLHLVDLALHLFHNWMRPEALAFYVPKLENEEEARYLKGLIAAAEELIHSQHASYQPGTVKLFIVFESPRSIFRIQAIAHELAPHFVGGSLGWHDFLGSTARLFRNDPGYRIPVKADPEIVIKHIKESHCILVRALEPLGALKIGGMYGVLYEDGNPASFAVSMVGYIKDVVTQLKRGLDGFWVAHPDFVRSGIALVAAWRRRQRNPANQDLFALIEALVPDEEERTPLLAFVLGEDRPGLEQGHPLYLRGVLAADIEESDLIRNSDRAEVRYNIFQALQYLADWLRGNGCVALPAMMRSARGEEVFVRIMDDLATTERSRWELWAEVHHGRVTRAVFEQILAEELSFIRAGRQTATKRVQVAWDPHWFPVAERILRQLVTDPEPVEWVTQLLLPFTFDAIRGAEDAWEAARRLCPGRYRG